MLYTPGLAVRDVFKSKRKAHAKKHGRAHGPSTFEGCWQLVGSASPLWGWPNQSDLGKPALPRCNCHSTTVFCFGLPGIHWEPWPLLAVAVTGAPGSWNSGSTFYSMVFEAGGSLFWCLCAWQLKGQTHQTACHERPFFHPGDWLPWGP